MGTYDTLVADLEELTERYRPDVAPGIRKSWAKAAAILLLPREWRIVNEQ